MKWILALTLAILSSSSFAYKITEYSGECFVKNEKKSQKCSIQKGVSSGGKFTYLQFEGKEYLIEQSTSCGGNCKPFLGTSPENVVSAKNYKNGKWDCYKQEKGQLDLCYAITK
ncbi:hypothetical protein [Acinetobacter gerneri]|uniref:hypothetical protein n=1 Tax=Acinetobacter gerneri TaxID=202952 RepID=UPI0028A73E07|nr:hypothetical protein [Acinetobacter gerneri]